MTLLIPKLLLESTAFWPESSSKVTRILNWAMIALWSVLVIGQVVFLWKKADNLPTAASVISVVSVGLQFIVKMLVLRFNAAALKQLLETIWMDFWPTNLAEFNLYRNLKFRSTALIVSSCCMCVSAYLFGLSFMSYPLIEGLRILPLQSVYPFNWTQSPTYELVYVTQWFAFVYVLVTSVCAHDCLFYGICANIIVQFLLLQQVISKLGSKFAKRTVLKLDQNLKQVSRKFNVRRELLTSAKWDDNDSKLLKRCIQHHQMLLTVCEDTKRIFAISCFLQLFASMSAMCMGCVLLTDKTSTDGFIFLQFFCYVLGHIIQLFLACALGNEVTYQAEAVTASIFCSDWYNIDSLKTKKDILFLLKGLQKRIAFSALGIADVDYSTFINVMKTSFSFYTMLLQLTEIKS